MLIGRPASTAWPAMDEASTLSRELLEVDGHGIVLREHEVENRLAPLAVAQRGRAPARANTGSRRCGLGAGLSSSGSTTYTLPASAPVICRLFSRIEIQQLLDVPLRRESARDGEQLLALVASPRRRFPRAGCSAPSMSGVAYAISRVAGRVGGWARPRPACAHTP